MDEQYKVEIFGLTKMSFVQFGTFLTLNYLSNLGIQKKIKEMVSSTIPELFFKIQFGFAKKIKKTLNIQNYEKNSFLNISIKNDKKYLFFLHLNKIYAKRFLKF